MTKKLFILIFLLVWLGILGIPTQQNGRESVEGITEKISRIEHEIWNLGKLDALDELFHPDCILHVPPLPEMKGIEGFKMIVSTFHHDIPDVQFHIEEIYAAGNRVTERYVWQGVHGKTEKKVTVCGCVIYHLKDDKVVEAWNFEDMLGFYQQLGLTVPGKSNQ